MRPRLAGADRVVFWDVDTQTDFMTPPENGGKLYVKDLSDDADAGAVQIIPALARLSGFARDHGILRVGTGDWHTPDHSEIDAEAPDFVSTYPPHCMAGEPGAEKIAETMLRDPVIVPLDATEDVARRAVRTARSENRDIFLQKKEFSCFTGNRATGFLLDELAAEKLVVYGVALDVCVQQAVDGMLDRGHTVLLVSDAVWGLGLHTPEELFPEWERRGLRRVKVDDVVDGSAFRNAPPALGS